MADNDINFIYIPYMCLNMGYTVCTSILNCHNAFASFKPMDGMAVADFETTVTFGISATHTYLDGS